MLVTKIFHLHQPVDQARERLRKLGTWNGSEEDVIVSCSLSSGIGRFDFGTREGHYLSADIEEVPDDDPNRILFRSVGGNIELAGLVELYPIRPNLTEVSLTLDYEPESRFQKVFGAIDHFLNRQLAGIEGCMERARAASTLSGRFA